MSETQSPGPSKTEVNFYREEKSRTGVPAKEQFKNEAHTAKDLQRLKVNPKSPVSPLNPHR